MGKNVKVSKAAAKSLAGSKPANGILSDIFKKVVADLISKTIIFGLGAALPHILQLLEQIKLMHFSSTQAGTQAEQDRWLASVLALLSELGTHRQRFIESAISSDVPLEDVTKEISRIVGESISSMRFIDFASLFSAVERLGFMHQLEVRLPVKVNKLPRVRKGI